MFNKKTFILLFLIFMISSSVKGTDKKEDVVKGMFNSLQREVFEEKECLSKIIGCYLKDEGLSYSITAGKDMHRICPSIVHSCCSREQMAAIHSKINTNYNKSDKTIELINQIIYKIGNMNEDRVNSLRKSLIEKDCIQDDPENEENMEFINNLKYFKDNYSMSQEIVRNGIEYVSKTVAGFGCSICDQASHTTIIHKRKEEPILQFDMKQCKTFFDSPESYNYIKMFGELGRLYSIFGTLKCINKDLDYRSQEFYTPDQFEDVVKSIKDCNNSNNFLKKRNCKTVCEEASLFNESVMAKYQEGIIIFTMFSDFFFLGEPMEDKESVMPVYKKMYEDIAFRFFLEPSGKSKLHFEGMKKRYEFGSGWNVVNHNFTSGEVELIKDKNDSIKIILKGMSLEDSIGKLALSIFGVLALSFTILI